MSIAQDVKLHQVVSFQVPSGINCPVAMVTRRMVEEVVSDDYDTELTLTIDGKPVAIELPSSYEVTIHTLRLVHSVAQPLEKVPLDMASDVRPGQTVSFVCAPGSDNPRPEVHREVVAAAENDGVNSLLCFDHDGKRECFRLPHEHPVSICNLRLAYSAGHDLKESA